METGCFPTHINLHTKDTGGKKVNPDLVLLFFIRSILNWLCISTISVGRRFRKTLKKEQKDYMLMQL